MKYEIKRLDEVEGDYRKDIAKLYIENFKNKMTIMSKDNDVLIKIFENTFVPSMYYVAMYEGKVVGIAACSSSTKRANVFNKQLFIKEFGQVKGRFLLMLVNAILAKPNARDLDEGYIESVATHEKHRGKGIATSLFKFIHENSGYKKFILDVIHGNDNAKHLYEKIGYNTYHIDKGFILKAINVKAMYLMEFTI